MPNRLIIATNNRHKVIEIREVLSGLKVEIVSPSDLGLDLNVVEDALTYGENAALKAKGFAQASGYWAIADDSGIEIAGLDNQPGVFSARYAGPEATDSQRVDLLLKSLAEKPAASRDARFVCAIALASPNGALWTVSGELRGVVAPEPRGKGGFGYDPIMYLPELGRTVAELTPEEKHAVSHRGRALRVARPLIELFVG